MRIFCPVVLSTFSAAACADFHECPAVDPAALAGLPASLSETGLYSDLARDQLAPGVREYRPRYELWSDGAQKRRFVALPEGAELDTSDMEDWQLPVGTKLWKEFVVGEVRVETRLIQRTGPGNGDWIAQAYIWSTDRSDAVAAPEGRADAVGTDHDVPSASDCGGCHRGRKSFALGFSAMQLGYDAGGDALDLGVLLDERLLSTTPPRVLEPPGDATAQRALGYLHANCSHCHNQDRPENEGPRCYDPERALDFRLLTSRLGDVEETPAYEAGEHVAEAMLHLMSRRGSGLHMPPLATEKVDEEGVAAVRAWVDTL